jgi:hypothetical protein
MNKTKIAIKYARALPVKKGKDKNEQAAASMSAEMMQLGFAPTKKLFNVLKTLTLDELSKVSKELIPVLKKSVGAHVKHKPFYPNFPKQVMEMSHLELYLNAILHYWSLGHWKPDFEELPREFHFENTKFKEIDVLTDKKFNAIFTRLLSSNDSISDEDKKVIEWFISFEKKLPTTAIPFKENLCFVAGLLLESGRDISGYITTATDVLRIATKLSDGDISLAANTKFKSLPRQKRKILIFALEKVIKEEDIKRHKNKWIRLFHSLHVGDFSNEVFLVAKKIRSNQNIKTFYTSLEEAVSAKKIGEAVKLLVTRPGEFARRIDHLLRMPNKKGAGNKQIVEKFLKVADSIPTRVLLQLYGNLKIRKESRDKRVVFPKGQTQKARIISGIPKLGAPTVNSLRSGIEKSLVKRFKNLDKLGKVYIDPALEGCPLPTQQRSASEGLFQVARGTALPLGDEDKNTLRFFIYWKGMDIDLSATLHDDEFKKIEHISYTNLKSAHYEACHSGDITRAHNGASEFIDITIDKAAKYGVRYVVMNVLVYSGEEFAKHEECFAGWMTRSKPESNEIFDPKTVVQKIDLRSASKNCIPVIFDIVEKKAICIDLVTKRSGRHGGNNIESNMASIEEVLEAMTNIFNKTTLYELMSLHAKARGKEVKNKEKADVVFALDEGITPYDVSVINSEYVI